MKRFLPLLMAAALVGMFAVGCTPAEEGKTDDGTPQVAELAITDGTIEYGELLTVKLQENPTTGYTWEHAIEGDSVSLSLENYVQKEEDKDVAGAGGQHDYVFKGSKEGTAKITFTHGQQWDNGEVDKEVVIEATTNEEGIFTKVKEL